MRILFIDDDVVFSNALSEMLEEQNIQVDQAESGESGIELADIYDYQAIVLDLGLPDMTGSDVLSELRKNGDETPVIVLSGQTEIEARLTCLNLGADDYLTKPVHSKELVARLRRWCAGPMVTAKMCWNLVNSRWICMRVRPAFMADRSI